MMLGNSTSTFRLNVASKRRIPSPVAAYQAAAGGIPHQHPKPTPVLPAATKPDSLKPRPEPLLPFSPSSWSIHGRHVSITPEVEQHVRDRLARTLHTLQSADVLESEGGVSEVDVRLMNSQADITLHPRILNKHMHDTYLQRGALHGSAHGHADALANFEMAVEQLEKKLHKWSSKGQPMKKDLHGKF